MQAVKTASDCQKLGKRAESAPAEEIEAVAQELQLKLVSSHDCMCGASKTVGDCVQAAKTTSDFQELLKQAESAPAEEVEAVATKLQELLHSTPVKPDLLKAIGKQHV